MAKPGNIVVLDAFEHKLEDLKIIKLDDESIGLEAPEYDIYREQLNNAVIDAFVAAATHTDYIDTEGYLRDVAEFLNKSRYSVKKTDHREMAGILVTVLRELFPQLQLQDSAGEKSAVDTYYSSRTTQAGRY